jgi:hypothetical protein
MKLASVRRIIGNLDSAWIHDAEGSHMSLAGSHTAHTPEDERRIREAALDETIEASFPASDPPSTDPNPDNEDAPPIDDEKSES